MLLKILYLHFYIQKIKITNKKLKLTKKTDFILSKILTNIKTAETKPKGLISEK